MIPSTAASQLWPPSPAVPRPTGSARVGAEARLGLRVPGGLRGQQGVGTRGWGQGGGSGTHVQAGLSPQPLSHFLCHQGLVASRGQRPQA